MDKLVNLKSVESYHSDDLKAVADWCEEMYSERFAPYFTEQREMFQRLKSSTHPITDDELEWILTCAPVNLFEASEKLAMLQTSQEIIKLKCKQKEADLISSSKESTETKRKEDAALKMVEDKILLMAYGNLAVRVEKEMSYSRELIMGAKKIWDARRRTDQSNPVKEVSTDLPDYSGKTYIK